VSATVKAACDRWPPIRLTIVVPPPTLLAPLPVVPDRLRLFQFDCHRAVDVPQWSRLADSVGPALPDDGKPDGHRGGSSKTH
jgi:hypothetical protein